MRWVESEGGRLRIEMSTNVQGEEHGSKEVEAPATLAV